jgi:hypothetical protein
MDMLLLAFQALCGLAVVGLAMALVQIKAPQGSLKLGLAAELARTVEELTQILGPAETPEGRWNRSLLSLQQCLDFAFLVGYVLVFVALGLVEAGMRFPSAAALGLASCGTAVLAGVFDGLEDLAILRAVRGRVRPGGPARFGYPKWLFVFLTLLAQVPFFFSFPGLEGWQLWVCRGIGILFLLGGLAGVAGVAFRKGSLIQGASNGLGLGFALLLVFLGHLFWRPEWAFPLQYLSLLRVPLLIGLALILLPYLAVFTGARSLLAGLFDVTPRGFFLVTVAAIAVGWTVLFTSRLILNAAPHRFRDVTPVSMPGTLVEWALVCSLLALPVIAACLWVSPRRDLGRRILAGVLAAAAMAGVFYAGLQLYGTFAPPLREAFEPVLHRWALRFPTLLWGYAGENLEDHLAAGLAFLIAFGIYLALGGFIRDRRRGRTVPALTSVLQLLVLLGWGFSGISFFFDAFRVPVFLVAGAWLAVMAQLPSSDHEYRIARRTSPRPVPPPTPAEVLAAQGRERVIVVAANGGGIQAAAWTAQVLTGLSEDLPGRFSPAVRFISAVSGGSVGAMHFVNAYGRAEGFAGVLGHAMESSLDEVAWGLVYPDLWRTIIPPVVKRWRTGRGQALEEAWKQRDAGLDAPLASWEDGVRSGDRPAVVFNATLAEKGVRLLASTAPLDENQGLKESHRARLNFQTLYPEHDVAVATAVRLSATFPYVTPAARADAPGDQPHVVDGGYFDNFGMSTLVEWLDAALTSCADQVKHVLVVQIRGAKVRTATAARMKQVAARGWFYQIFAPIATMLNVRGTGQVSHNETEYGLLQRAWAGKVELRSVVLEFPGDDPPTSWHLNEEQKKAIVEAWESPKIRACRDEVKAFLE